MLKTEQDGRDYAEFFEWWRASKYCQVAYPKEGWEQIAYDGWCQRQKEIDRLKATISILSGGVEAIEAKCIEAEKDANRYRFMRDNPVFAPVYDEDWIVTYLNNGSGPEAGVCDALFSTLDGAVDFMMETK